MTEVVKDLWRSTSPALLLKQGHMEQSGWFLSIYKEGGSTASLGNL